VTFNPASAISILDILSNVELPDKDLILELGSQRYTSSHIFKADSTYDFYIKNGFKDYIALDINSTKYTKQVDLNEPYKHETQASLVTNIGTSEHCFDQGRIFETIHDCCKVGGVMFHHLPFAPWPNHGFYNYCPILFEALATANDYRLLFLKIGDREGNCANLSFDKIVLERGQQELEDLSRGKTRLFIYAAFQKKHDAAFKKPFQKRYVPDIANNEILQRYA
jgi:hypothetical protein